MKPMASRVRPTRKSLLSTAHITSRRNCLAGEPISRARPQIKSRRSGRVKAHMLNPPKAQCVRSPEPTQSASQVSRHIANRERNVFESYRPVGETDANRVATHHPLHFCVFEIDNFLCMRGPHHSHEMSVNRGNCPPASVPPTRICEWVWRKSTLTDTFGRRYLILSDPPRRV